VIAALLRAMRGQSARAMPPGDPDEDSPAFVSGLALGALVGAAIAGSTLWHRFRARSPDARDEPDSRIETSVPE
jgi:hypothetical protein